MNSPFDKIPDIAPFRIVQIDDLYIRCAVYERVIEALIAETGIDTSRIRAAVLSSDLGCVRNGRAYPDQVEELNATLERIGAGPQFG